MMSKYDYEMAGNHNYYSDLAHARDLMRGGMPTVADYEMSGHHDAQNLVIRDSMLVNRFFGAYHDTSYDTYDESCYNTRVDVRSSYTPTKLYEPAPHVVEKRKIKEELLVLAEKLSDVILAEKGSVTFDDVDRWRIERGYFAKTVTPRGIVIRETLKQIRITDREEYIEYAAMKFAYTKTTGMYY